MSIGIVVWTVGILIAVTLFVRWLEPRMAFYPIRGVQETPATLQLPFSDVRITTADGETLHAWWLQHPTAKAQVVFFHGNGGNLSLWLDVVAGLRERGYSVLAVEYRGYGASSGRPSEAGLYEDGAASVKLFRERLATSAPIIYWGRSIGCPVAARAATILKPDALVLETPMPDVRTILRSSPLLWGLSFFSTYRFATSEWLQSYDGPLLVVHGDADSIVPFSAGRLVFERARSQRKQFVMIPGADHNDLHLVNPERYWRAILDFLAPLESR